jgi:hypothetical protein
MIFNKNCTEIRTLHLLFHFNKTWSHIVNFKWPKDQSTMLYFSFEKTLIFLNVRILAMQRGKVAQDLFPNNKKIVTSLTVQVSNLINNSSIFKKNNNYLDTAYKNPNNQNTF